MNLRSLFRGSTRSAAWYIALVVLLPILSLSTLGMAYLWQNKVFALEQLLYEQEAAVLAAGTRLRLDLYKVLLYVRSNRHDMALRAFAGLGDEAVGCELCGLTEAYLHSSASPTDALATLDELLVRYPDNAQAYLLRGQLYFSLRNPGRAFPDFMQFQRLQPLAGYAQFLLAVTALQMDDPAAAERHVNKLLAASPRQPLANHLKALLAFEQKNYAVAGEHAELSIGRGLKSPANFLVAGVSAYHLHRPEAAYYNLRKAEVFYPDNPELQRLLMFIQLQLGDFEAARESFIKQDLHSVQDVLFGNLMAYKLLQDGSFGEAGSVLAYLEHTPITQPAIRLQTQALKAQLAVAEVLPATALSNPSAASDPTGWMVRIMILLESNAPAEAQRLAGQWLRQNRDSVDALNIQAYVFQQTGQGELALGLYERALVIDPANTPSLFYLAGRAATASDYAGATGLYQRILQQNPANLAALRALLGLTFTAQDDPDWEQLLRPLDASGLSDDQMVAVADALFQWQQYPRLDRFLAQAGPSSQWSDTLWMIWIKNSYFLSTEQDFLQNFAAYQQANPLPDHVLFVLSFLEQQSRWQLSLDLIQQLDNNIRKGQSLQLAQAVAHIELQQFAEAEKILALWPEKDVPEAARWYVKGRLKESAGDLPQAVVYLQAYYNASPGFHSVSHLSNLLLKAGRIDALQALANSHTHDHPADDSSRLALSLKLAPTQPAHALALVQHGRADWLVRRSWQLSNNVALLYLQQGLPETALQYATNALALRPDDERLQATHARVQAALAVPLS